MIKGWQFSNRESGIKENENKVGMGYCYAVKFQVMAGFYLIKIGATQQPISRFYNIPRAKIYCLSPQHLNYYENEGILHEYFSKFRIPRKPEGKSQVELFNMDLPYFFSNLPDLVFETNIKKCEKVILPNGSVYYKTK